MSEDLSLAPANETHDLAPNCGQSEVLSVVRHTIVPGKEPEDQAWLREIVPIAATAEGHRGVNVIRPHVGARTYTIVLHFDALEHLERWLASDVRKRLILKYSICLKKEIKSRLRPVWSSGSRRPRRSRSVRSRTSSSW